MANDKPQVPNPDEPWLTAKDVARPVTYVYRVRYIINEIEVLELVSKVNVRLLVRDPKGEAPETWIEGHEVYDTFDAARERLVALNRERVAQVEADLRRAKDKLDVSMLMFLDVADGDDDEEDDEGLNQLAPHQVPGGDNIWA